MRPEKQGYLKTPQRSRVQIEHDLDIALSKRFVTVDAEFLELYRKKVLLKSERILKSELKELILYLGLKELEGQKFPEIHRQIRELKFGKSQTA